eukprot:COSAG05_NODE_225_length_13597_cov_18.878723_2_plen_380_part_00
MIVYDTKKWFGWIVLVKCSGSVFHLAAPYALVAGLIAFAVKMDNAYDKGFFDALKPQHVDSNPLFHSPYSLQIWGTTVGFLLVFRGNLAYARYWDGRGHLAKLSAYLAETAMMAVCYDEINKEMNQYREWKVEILHQISLLHALAIQCLRLDVDLDNLVKFNRLEAYGQDQEAGSLFADTKTGKAGLTVKVTNQGNVERTKKGLDRRGAMISPSNGMGRRRYSIDADALREQLLRQESTGLESELGTLREGTGENLAEEGARDSSEDEQDEYQESRGVVPPILPAAGELEAGSPASNRAGSLPPIQLPGTTAAVPRDDEQAEVLAVSQQQRETLATVSRVPEFCQRCAAASHCSTRRATLTSMLLGRDTPACCPLFGVD